MEAVLEQFREFDSNGDGVITKAELRQVLKALDPGRWTEKRLSQLVKLVDRNGDGNIQFEEFIGWLYGADQANGFTSEEVRKSAAAVLRSKCRAAQAAAKAGDFANAMRLAREQPEVVNMQHSSNGETLMHQAAWQGNVPAFGLLLELRGDPMLTNKAGQTAVQVAVSNRDDELVEFMRTVPQAVPPDALPSQLGSTVSTVSSRLRKSRTSVGKALAEVEQDTPLGGTTRLPSALSRQ